MVAVVAYLEFHLNNLGSSSDNAWVEGVAIMLTVLIVVVVTTLNNYTKERQFRSLKSKLDSEYKFLVIRGGRQEEVPIFDLVVGDIVEIKYGKLLGARLLMCI